MQGRIRRLGFHLAADLEPRKKTWGRRFSLHHPDVFLKDIMW
jgi:hypothetical protein